MKHDIEKVKQGGTPVRAVEADKAPPALLFEMTRSFVTLARTLNLSKAVKELGSTRQTLRRHITLLEEEMGTELFQVEDRRYTLTQAGEKALPEAINLVARSTMWLRGTSRHQEGLQQIVFNHPDGWNLFQQQHPLGRVWNGDSVLMRETLRAWAMSGGNIESPHMTHVRPYLIVYRLSPTGWITVEFGEESFYVKWFGLVKARSSIGRNVGKLPGGEQLGRLLEQSFEEVTNTQSARLDHVFTQVPKEGHDGLLPIRYARLMLGGQFPDQSPALFALVEPMPDVIIEGLDIAALPPINSDVFV